MPVISVCAAMAGPASNKAVAALGTAEVAPISREHTKQLSDGMAVFAVYLGKGSLPGA